MRILMTTDTIGGVWTLTCELTRQLLDRGHAVALVSFGRTPSPGQEAWCCRIAAEYKHRFLYRASDTPLEWMSENITAFSGGVNLLVDTACEFRADLLHAHQFCWGALPGDLPRLITAHSDVMSWAANCRPEGLKASAWLIRYCALVQRGLDSTDAVVVPTSWMQRSLANDFHVPCRVFVIPNGRSVPADTKAARRRLRAVSVGRLWDEAKGIQTLLEIEPPLPILVAGEEKFESSSASTGTLKALGILDESALFELFCSSSIYIATSIYEPFGLAPLEAALCGCAVVARNLPSLREVWADAALFFENAEELARCLRRLADDPDMLRIAQRKACMRAGQFTAGRMADQYLALYEFLLVSTHALPTFSRELATHAM